MDGRQAPKPTMETRINDWSAALDWLLAHYQQLTHERICYCLGKIDIMKHKKPEQEENVVEDLVKEALEVFGPNQL